MSLRPDTKIDHLERGTILDDRFEIVEFLGAGSFGEVYRAKQLVFGQALRDVAIKLFKADKVTSDNVHEVFCDAVSLIGLQEDLPEPEIASKLVQVYDIGTLKTPTLRAFISMKLVRGKKTLANPISRWKSGGMPVETSLRFLRQILAPLAWMHTLDQAAVHGDIKPDNILMDEQSNLILTDFGLAARLPLGSFGGAVQYQAPESLLGGEAKEAADVYAVGLTWYEMLTGHHPFEDVGLEAIAAGDDRAFLEAHQMARKWSMRDAGPALEEEDQRIRPPSEYNEEMLDHPQLQLILQKSLAYLPSNRYANARLMLRDIDNYLGIGVADVTISEAVAKTYHDALPDQTRDKLTQDVEAWLRSGRNCEARETARKIVQRYPKFVQGLLVLARAQAACGEIDEAKATCTEAQQLEPQAPEVFEIWAMIFEAEGKLGMATAMRNRAGTLRQDQGKRKRRGR